MGLDQRELARRLGVSPRTLWRLEQGVGEFNTWTIKAAVDWLNRVHPPDGAEATSPPSQNSHFSQLTGERDARTVGVVVQRNDESEPRLTVALKEPEEETVSVAFKVPKSVAARLKDEAWREKTTVSGYLRAILSEKLTDKSE